MIETQATIDKWGTATFGRGAPPAIGRRLRDEVNELFEALAGDPNVMTEATRAEVADVAILLFRLAAVSNFNLWESIDSKMRLNRKRKWRSNGDGTGEHVREGE